MNVTVQRLVFVDESKYPGEKLNSTRVGIAKAVSFQVVVGNHYEDGQLCFVIPPGATIPDKLLDEMWLKGKLAGANKNKCKERKMYGVTSEALVYGAYYYDKGQRIESPSWNKDWVDGQDITQEVGITFDETRS